MSDTNDIQKELAQAYNLTIGESVILDDDSSVPAEQRSVVYKLERLQETPSGMCIATVSNTSGEFHVPCNVLAARSHFQK